MPLTFHINHENSTQDPNSPIEVINEWEQFKNYAFNCAEKVWIVKPGENSNRGFHIEVFDDVEEIKAYTSDPSNKHTKWVVQK